MNDWLKDQLLPHYIAYHIKTPSGKICFHFMVNSHWYTTTIEQSSTIHEAQLYTARSTLEISKLTCLIYTFKYYNELAR